MRLKKILINRYGPLRDIRLDIGRGTQIIYGKNEAGKTLTIDALLKIMLGKKIKEFDGIDRVEEFPEGYLVLEDNNNEEIKLDKELSLSKYARIDSTDLRNIFVIRNSDLTIREEDSYFNKITDRLTGLETEKINKLMAELMDYGKLTSASSNADLSDKKGYGKIKSRLTDCRELIKDIEEYVKEVEENGLDSLELEQLKINQKIREVKKEISLAERNLKHKNYLELKELFRKLKSTLREYKGYSAFSEEEYQQLIDFNNKLNNLSERQKSCNADLKRLEERQDSFKKEAAKLSSELAPYREKEKEVVRLEQKAQGIEGQKTRTSRLPLVFMVIFLALSGISIIPLFLFNGLFYAFPPIFFGIMFVVFFILYFLGQKKVFSAKRSEEEILNGFLGLGIKVTEIGEIPLEANNFLETKSVLDNNLRSIESEMKANEKQRERLLAELKSNEREIKEIKGSIHNKIGELNIANTNIYRQKLDKKRELETEIFRAYRLIMDKLELEVSNLTAETVEEELGFLKENIEKTKPRKELEKIDKDYNQQFYEEKKRELESLQLKQDEIAKKLDGHNYKIKELESRYLNLLSEDFLNKIKVNNLSSLKTALQSLNSEAEKIKNAYNVSKQAIGIFEDILRDEQIKVADLFENLSISGYFSEITLNKYKKVFYDADKKKVMVANSNGNTMDDSKLSKGAYDQLYMAVRVALAEKILDEPAFFIVDDAFIYSDAERLEAQFEVLNKLVMQGWSIVYFSVKDEIRKLAKQYSSNNILTIGDKVG